MRAPSPSEPDEALDEAIEEALEEAAFFAEQGLIEDALEALQEALTSHPEHPVLVAKMRALAGESETPPGVPDESFALAQTLAQEDQQRSQPPHPPHPPGEKAPPADGQEVAVDQVLAQFKAGVEKSIDKDDVATHHDLGIAYMEMGLHAEAIEEFELCLVDPARRCQSHTLLGFCRVSQGQMAQAIEHFESALTSGPTDAERLELWFELGNAFELNGKPAEALAQYERVAEVDPRYRDVTERIQRLSQTQEASDDDAALDAMFDDILLKD